MTKKVTVKDSRGFNTIEVAVFDYLPSTPEGQIFQIVNLQTKALTAGVVDNSISASAIRLYFINFRCIGMSLHLLPDTYGEEWVLRRVCM